MQQTTYSRLFGPIAGLTISGLTAGLISITSAIPAIAVPAFPGAQGYGATSVGGRGGRVIEVTNLNDSGPGSFREAVLATGPRTIVFRVGGTITLNSKIEVTGAARSNLTIAGQTAPGGGVQIKGWHLLIGPGVSDVIIRYMRFRPGETAPQDWSKFSLMLYGEPGQPTQRVIVDHCSTSWAPDDTGAWSHVNDVTFQDSIFAEALIHDYPGYPPNSTSKFSRGMILGTAADQGSAMRNISILRNYFAHNSQRNPLIGGDGPFEMVNNVIYNWSEGGTSISSRGSGAKVNLIGNYYKTGPSLKNARRYAITIDPPRNPDGFVYVQDNLGPYRPNGGVDQWAIVGSGLDPNNYMTVQAPKSLQRGTPWPTSSYPATIKPGGSDTVADIMRGSGATLPARDAVDIRVVNDFYRDTGAIRNGSQLQNSDWPVLANGTPPADTDKDGMPDSWEQTYSLNPNVVDGASDVDGDGYTNLEEFLNGTNPRVR